MYTTLSLNHKINKIISYTKNLIITSKVEMFPHSY